MKVYIEGHNHRYALETMCLLFFPGCKFEYCESGADSDTQVKSVMRLKDNILTSEIELYIDGAAEKGEARAACPKDPLERKRVEQAIIKRAFYDAATALTGIVPPWGILTGIRPAKVAREMLAKGESDDKVVERLEGEYFLRKDRAELCLEVAKKELDLLKDEKPGEVSLYISIPFCPSRCSYCSFVSHSIEKAGKLVPEYVRLLCREIEDISNVIKQLSLKVKTIYIGGGTPTSLSAEDLEQLMQTVSSNIDCSNLREYTVEAGRPDTITREKLEIIRRHGADRISINPQTMNDEVLKAIGRRHTAAEIVEKVKAAKEAGFRTINMDLIAGLESDTVESFRRTLDEVINLEPQNITVHTLCIKRASNMRILGDAVYRAQSEPVLHMLDYAFDKLKGSGFDPYYLYRQKNTIGNFENVGYSQSGHECFYNIYIMQEIHSIFSVGAGAVTKLVSLDRSRIERIFNSKYPYEYISRFEDIEKNKDDIFNFYKNKY